MVTPDRPMPVRRKRTNAESSREALLSLGIDYLERHCIPVSAEMPRYEDVIESSGIARASAYRVYPYKDDFASAVVEAYVERKAYDTKRLEACVDELLGQASDGQLARTALLTGIGLAQVVQINHVADNRIESVVSSMRDPDTLARIEEKLRERRGKLLETTGLIYIEAHSVLGEEIDEPLNYARSAANLARGYAMAPFGELENATLSAGFLALAGVHAKPVGPIV